MGDNEQESIPTINADESQRHEVLIEEAQQAVFDKYDQDAAKAEDITEEATFLGKKHVEHVRKNAVTFGQEVGLEELQMFQLEMAATLHDVEKFSAARTDWRERLLLHAPDGVEWSKKYLSQQGVDEQNAGVILNAILRHQPAPYIAAKLEELIDLESDDAEWGKTRALLETMAPDVVESRKFLGPNDEVSAVLYAADLLAAGDLVSNEEEDPRCGAFDKIVEIELMMGSTFPEAIENAHKSLAASYAQLRGATEGISVMRQESTVDNGRAPEILAQIADKYGAKLVARSRELVKRVKRTDPQLYEGRTRMECMVLYYQVAREIENLPENSEVNMI